MNCGPSKQHSSVQCEKEMSYQATERQGGNLGAHHQVKEANQKRLHPAGFQQHDLLEKAKLWTHLQVNEGLSEGRGGKG